MVEHAGLYYPNRIARAFFAAMDDVMGQYGLSQLLETADLQSYLAHPPPDNLERQFDFAEIAALNRALETVYGLRGGQGMALRIGLASFARGLKTFGIMRAVDDPAFRALPLDRRIEYGLKALATLLTNFSDQASFVQVEEDVLLFISEVSPYSWGRQADKPVCHMMVGILQECLRWVSNGREYYVREIECSATGDQRCVFRISRVAIGT